MRFALVLFTLFWSPLAYGQEPVPVDPVVPEVVTIKLPETLNVKAGRIVRIDAETTGKKVRWLAIQLATDATKDQPNILPEDVDLYPVDESAHSVFFCCPTSGTMTLFAWTAGGDYPTPPAICRLVIEQKGPRPPPGPNPPPVTDLKKRVVDGFVEFSVTGPQRVADAKILFGVTSAVAIAMQTAPDLIPDRQALHDQYKAALEVSGWTKGRYPVITKIIKDEFSADNEAFTVDSRKVVVEKLKQIADGAKEVAK